MGPTVFSISVGPQDTNATTEATKHQKLMWMDGLPFFLSSQQHRHHLYYQTSLRLALHYCKHPIEGLHRSLSRILKNNMTGKSITESILPTHHDHTSPPCFSDQNRTTSPFSPRSPRRRLFHRPRSSAACQPCFATIWILACSITFGLVVLSNRLVLPRTMHVVLPPEHFFRTADHQRHHRQPGLFKNTPHITTKSTFGTVQLLLQDNLVGSTAIDGPPLDAHEEERLAEFERDEEESPLSFLLETATHTVQLFLQENLFGSEAILKDEEEEFSKEKGNLVQDSDNKDNVDYYADPMATTSFDEEENDIESETTQRDLVYPEDWSSQEYEDDLV